MDAQGVVVVSVSFAGATSLRICEDKLAVGVSTLEGKNAHIPTQKVVCGQNLN